MTNQRLTMTQDDIATTLAGLAAALAVLVPIVPRLYARIKRDNKVDGSDEAALKHLDAAVAHWKGLYETAWKQIAKERELRELAERRTTATVMEVEELRGEVAALRRQIEHLTTTVKHYQSAPIPGAGVAPTA